MQIPSITTLVLWSLPCQIIYYCFLYPLFLHPLANIPAAHWSAPLSRFWILFKRCRQEETPSVHAAHQRLGPIIRIAPNEISVNSLEGGVRTIYAGGFAKGDWYRNIFNNYGIMPMFSMPDHASHSKRKRMLSNVYAKSTLQSSAALKTISQILIDDRLVPSIRKHAENHSTLDMYHVFCAATMDFVSAYVFGLKNGSDFLRDPAMGRDFFRLYKARQIYGFWPQDLPSFTAFMGLIGLRWLLVPSWLKEANDSIEAWILAMCDHASGDLEKLELGDNQTDMAAEDYPAVYAQLRTALKKEISQTPHECQASEEPESLLPVSKAEANEQRFSIASEMVDHTLAGFDTSSITLTFLAWELSRPTNLKWQTRMRAEIATLADKKDPKTIDALPTLHAILMETLRLHAAIPGNQPRVTPASATLGPPGLEIHAIPANVRVQAQAWSLHRNADVFPNPDTWDPSRWLNASDEHHREMQRWFWAFGSGGRMCVGRNLAIYDMKAIIVGIWASFRTEVLDDEGMVHNGGYVAEPKGKNGKFLVVQLYEDEAKAEN